MNLFYLIYLFNIVNLVNLDYIKKLTKEDLNENKELLIFIYYENSKFTCPYCEFYSYVVSLLYEKYKDKNFIRKINFFENPRLGSRFLLMSFPYLVFYKHGRVHLLHNEKMLGDIENFDLNLMYPCKNCRNWKYNPNSTIIKIYSVSSGVFFGGLYTFYKIFDLIPVWVWSLFICLVIAFAIKIVFHAIFKKKVKEDLDDGNR
ncbi:hypothetical protein EDEG_00373 [Edhazardia aedis USNM 41457]|uniref:Thioredoxin domain-containing protein n=1 Tax=Edhazardia aedis (strain USNM 41457) TaxID=1003232 RepID=J9DK86_EDHAE|nr:hypothetical protein EDEG_00373 [Edhazardia aedis USNM 41457]|eukprot:EJW01782.1 hypothetical protein EDEG_00373 [Edhazardia aedis USNM 41457]